MAAIASGRRDGRFDRRSGGLPAAWRGLACAMAIGAGLCGLPGVARASTVAVRLTSTPPNVVYTAAAGEVNEVTVARDPLDRSFLIDDARTAITPGAGCQLTDPPPAPD